MLSKVKNILFWKSGSVSVSGNNWYTAISGIPPTWYSKLFIEMYDGYTTWMTEIREGTTTIYQNYSISGTQAEPYHENLTLNITNNGSTINFIYSSVYSQSFVCKVNVYLTNENIPFIPTLKALSVKPYDVKELGELATALLYGKDTNGEYVGGIITNTDTTATTWNITLGNAVGYLTVNFNGNNYKIPYYNE